MIGCEANFILQNEANLNKKLAISVYNNNIKQ